MRTSAKSSMTSQPRSPSRTSGWTSARSSRRTGTIVPVSSLVNPSSQPTFYENGLLYYQEWRDTYPYPCDDRAAERMDVLHSLIYEEALSGALHQAQLDPPRNERLRVLDIGCGSARWAQDMANVCPDADVFGIDIGDVDDRLEPGVSNNFYFRSGVNFESADWDADYKSGSFHFIHMAQLQGAVSDWRTLLRRAHRLLAPGGHLEVIEIDWAPHTSNGKPDPTSAYHRWWEAMTYASNQHGKPVALDVATLKNHLVTSGFAIQQHTTKRLDLWERVDSHVPGLPSMQYTRDELAMQARLAGWTRLLLGTPALGFFDASAMALLTSLPGWTPNDVRGLAACVIREINKYQCPLYFELHIWTVRKRGSV